MLDIGSGAGFPGLVIAAAINASVTLVEARRKRATFLTEAVIEMGLKNVRVECARAESLELRDSSTWLRRGRSGIRRRCSRSRAGRCVTRAC